MELTLDDYSFLCSQCVKLCSYNIDYPYSGKHNIKFEDDVNIVKNVCVYIELKESIDDTVNYMNNIIDSIELTDRCALLLEYDYNFKKCYDEIYVSNNRRKIITSDQYILIPIYCLLTDDESIPLFIHNVELHLQLSFDNLILDNIKKIDVMYTGIILNNKVNATITTNINHIEEYCYDIDNITTEIELYNIVSYTGKCDVIIYLESEEYVIDCIIFEDFSYRNNNILPLYTNYLNSLYTNYLSPPVINIHFFQLSRDQSINIHLNKEPSDSFKMHIYVKSIRKAISMINNQN